MIVLTVVYIYIYILMEIRNSCFRYYFVDGDTEILILLMLRDMSTKGVTCASEEVYGDRKFCVFPFVASDHTQ